MRSFTAVLLALASLSVLPSGAVAARRWCGTFRGSYVYRGHRYHYTAHYFVDKGRITCRGARATLAQFNSGKHVHRHGHPPSATTYYTLPHGWTCSSGTGTTCIRPGRNYRRAHQVISEYVT